MDRGKFSLTKKIIKEMNEKKLKIKSNLKKIIIKTRKCKLNLKNWNRIYIISKLKNDKNINIKVKSKDIN